MTTPAKISYLSALIGESQQRTVRHEANLCAAVTRPDTVAATATLKAEQARSQELTTERARLAA